MQQLERIITRMVYPNATVNSLVCYANKLQAKYGEAGLQQFLQALCKQNIYKAMQVVERLFSAGQKMAKEPVIQILSQRCENRQLSHWELLAIAVGKQEAMLKENGAAFTQDIIREAMAAGDFATACSLLKMSFTVLEEEPCRWVQVAFCDLLGDYNEHMETAMQNVLPDLLEHDAVEVLSALVRFAGVAKVDSFYGSDLLPQLERMVMSGKDSVEIWRLFFQRYFRQPHTEQELLAECFWQVQLFASNTAIQEACAEFFLYAATCYGVKHPIFTYIDCVTVLEEYSHNYISRYKDAIRPLWNQPEALSEFLERTANCNPFRTQNVQNRRYHFLQMSQDRTGYNRLHSLFQQQTPIEKILNIFFSTDLKERLPLEDVFCLAQRYEVLEQLLEALQDTTFTGVVSSEDGWRMYLAPYAYFSTALHSVPVTYKIVEEVEPAEELKGQDWQYSITGFYNGYIQVKLQEKVELPELDLDEELSWADAVENVRNLKNLAQKQARQLEKLPLAEFTLDSLLEENDLNLLTDLLRERHDCLPVFLKLFKISKWNASFLKPNIPLPKTIFGTLAKYRTKAVQLLQFLFETQPSAKPVLQLYFYSIYRAIVPLSMLLNLAPREMLLEHLPRYAISCRLQKEGTELCRPTNISCAPVCRMEKIAGLPYATPFEAAVVDFTVQEDFVSQIVLRARIHGAADVDERGTIFGYLTTGVSINRRREERIATFPPAAECTHRELRFNIRCMRDAIAIRRTNGAEMKRLLQVLGKANPFAFQENELADRIYLNKPDADADVEDMAVTALLNAANIADVRDLYLHTHIKYHLSLPQWAQWICLRRPDLVAQIPKMFEETEFFAIADSHGGLWLPWVEQDTLQVDAKYAGMYLRCRVQLDSDGRVSVQVLDAGESEHFFELMDICLLMGYRSDAETDALVQNHKRPADPQIPERPWSPWDEDAPMPIYGEYYNWLRRYIHSDEFTHEAFADAIVKMIGSYAQQISDRRMKDAVVELSRKWLHCHTDAAVQPALLLNIYNCFMSCYRQKQGQQTYQPEKLRAELAQLLYQYLGADYSYQFRVGAIVPVKAKDLSTDTQLSFEAKCQNMYTLLSGAIPFAGSPIRQMISMIYAHHATVPAEQMLQAIGQLTEVWMQNYTMDADALAELLLLHNAYVLNYQTSRLGLAMCEQAHRYMDSENADTLEARICKTTCQYLGDHPQLKDMLPPFEPRVTRLRGKLQNAQGISTDLAKQIGKLIRNYSRIVPVEEMKPLVLEMTSLLLQNYSDCVHVPQLLSGLKKTFQTRYPDHEISEELIQQARQYLPERALYTAQSQLGQYRHDAEETEERPPFEQVCRQFSQQLQTQSVPAIAFLEQIMAWIRDYSADVGEEEMLQAICTLTEQFMSGGASSDILEKGLFDCHMQFANRYQSVALGVAFCQLGYRYLSREQGNNLRVRVNSSLTRITGGQSDTATLKPPFGWACEQLDQDVKSENLKPNKFSHKVSKLIRDYASQISAEEMAQVVSGLTQALMSRCPADEDLKVYLYGINDSFFRRYGSCDFYEKLCLQIRQLWDAEEAQAYEKRLQIAMDNHESTERM